MLIKTMMFIDWNETFLQRKTEEVKGNLVHPEASSWKGHKIEMLIVLHTSWRHLQQTAEMSLNSLFRNFCFMLMSKISWYSLSGRSNVYLIPDVPNRKTAFFSYKRGKNKNTKQSCDSVYDILGRCIIFLQTSLWIIRRRKLLL